MKLLLILLFAFITNVIKAESNAKPDGLFIPREQEPGDNFARVYSNHSPRDDSQSSPKTIVVSGVSDQMAKEQPQHVMQAVVKAVQSQFKRDMANGVIKDPNMTNAQIPDVFFSEPVREVNDQQSVQPQRDSSPKSSQEVVQRVYKLPAVTRMISREEETDNDIKGVNNKDNNFIKKIQIWRSPVPFIYNDMHNKLFDRKLKSYRKKGRRHNNKNHLSFIRPLQSESTPIFMRAFRIIKKIEPKIESRHQMSPLKTSLMTIIPRPSEPEPEPEQPHNKDSKSKPCPMSRNKKIEPEIELPLRHDNMFRPPMPLVMALLRKRLDKQEQESPLPFNPFLRLLSKLIQKPIPLKGQLDFISGKAPTREEKAEKPINNYNFNVNFTINNNYAQKEMNPLFESQMPFPFLRYFSII